MAVDRALTESQKASKYSENADGLFADLDRFEALRYRLIHDNYGLRKLMSAYQKNHDDKYLRVIEENAYMISEELRNASEYLKRLDLREASRNAYNLAGKFAKISEPTKVPVETEPTPQAIEAFTNTLYKNITEWHRLTIDKAREFSEKYRKKPEKEEAPLPKTVAVLILVSAFGSLFALLNNINSLEQTANVAASVPSSLVNSIIFSVVIVVLLISLVKQK